MNAHMGGQVDMRIRIVVGKHELSAILNEKETAQAIVSALPIEFHGNTWGDEIYGAIPVAAGMDNGTMRTQVGDLAFWPPGNAFCIFYGPTPASVDENPVPASEVILVGRIEGDATILRGVTAGPVRLEAFDD